MNYFAHHTTEHTISTQAFVIIAVVAIIVIAGIAVLLAKGKQS